MILDMNDMCREVQENCLEKSGNLICMLYDGLPWIQHLFFAQQEGQLAFN